MTKTTASKWIARTVINRKLDAIRERIGKDNSEILHRELDEIFTYKPVDNYYVLVRGELYLQEKKYEEVANILLNKDMWSIPDPYGMLLSELQYRMGLACNDTYNTNAVQIFSYFIYLASKREMNKEQKFFCHEEYIAESQKLYEEECEREINALRELLTIDFHSEEKKAYQILERLFYIHHNLFEDIQALIVIAARGKIGMPEGKGYTAEQFFRDLETRQPNMGYIAYQLLENQTDKFLLISDGKNSIEKYRELCKCLNYLGKKCILLDNPISVELDYQIDKKDTVSISMENKEGDEECMIIYPVELFLLGETIGTNTIEIVEELLEAEEKTYFNVITSEMMFRSMKQSRGLEKRVQIITEYSGETFEDFIGFGYAGDYATYISRIYGFDYQKSLLEESRCRYSIVIPARNSAYTLQHTLKTCLEQRGNIDYEIIISDNSDEDNSEVKNLVTSLHDKRLQYVRTPVSLPLAKSFEFAYGKARGEFILPLGSDDGLLPWALETLEKMREKYPEDTIIAWGRGFFQWTESQNSQRGKMIIPKYYKKGEFGEVEYNAPLSLKKQMETDAEFIYEMPLLYINSAFKRSFLSDMYEKTGTLLDGYTQDISMGIKSLLINDKFVFLQYPLSIAAISDASLGGRMALACISDDHTKEKIYTERKQGFGKAVIESTKPFYALGTTEGMFWGEIFKMYLLPGCREMLQVLLEGHDWKKSIEVMFTKLNIRDVSYMKQLELLRFNTYQIDWQIGKWFDSHLYKGTTESVCKIELQNEVETGQETGFATGFLEMGLTLDAKKFGVNTVDEAVDLFVKITNL